MPWKQSGKRVFSSGLCCSDQFKSYEDLKTRLDYVLGIKGTPKMQDQETVEEEQAFEAERRGETVSDFNSPDITVSSMMMMILYLILQNLLKTD